MKRFFFILFSLMVVSSCLDDGSGMTQTYTNTATFQYAKLDFFPDSTFFNTSTPEGFAFDVLNFYHQLDPGKVNFDGGFILSRLEMPVSGNTEGLNNTYRCYIKDAKKMTETNIYTVFHQSPDPSFMPTHDIQFPYVKMGSCQLLGCFINNTVEVADYVKANFEVGDRLTVKATGYNNGVPTGTSEINLADISVRKDSIVSKWTAFELDALGEIEYVDFEIISTKPGTPAYFCMDQLTYKATLTY